MAHSPHSTSTSYTPFPQQLYASDEQRGLASDDDLIGVLGFLPTEGEVGCPITARIQFSEKWNHAQQVSVRLVVVDKPVATEISQDAYGTYKLDAAVPYLSAQVLASFASKVPLSIQVLETTSGKVLDQLTFGDFTYWTSGWLHSIYLSALRPRFSCCTSSQNDLLSRYREPGQYWRTTSPLPPLLQSLQILHQTAAVPPCLP